MYDIVSQRLRLFLAKKDITCKKLSAMIFMSEYGHENEAYNNMKNV